MKVIKRLMSFMLVLGLIISTMPGICVNAEEPFEYDFMIDGWQTREADKNYVSVIDYNDGDDGKVIESKASYTTRYISSYTFPDTTVDKTLHFSFDFKFVSTTANYGYMYVKDGAIFPHDMETASNYPSFMITPDYGFSYFSQDWTHATNKIEGAKSDVWYRIDSIYDLKNKKVKHYVDGQYIGEGNTKNNHLSAIELCPSTLKGHTSSLDAISGGTYYFDNIRIKELGENITAKWDADNTAGSVIALKFSEPVSSNDFSKLTLVDCETFEEKTVSSYEQIDSTIIGLKASGLKYGAEYKLSIPAGIKGAYGNTTKEAEIFVNAADEVKFVPGGTPAGKDEEIYTDDLNSYEAMKFPEEKGAVNTADSKKWSIPNVAWEGYGITILEGDAGNKYINIRPKQQGSAAGLAAHALLGETKTSGAYDIYFDAAVQNPVENDSIMQSADSSKPSTNYLEILLGKAGVDANYPIAQINRSSIKMYLDGTYGTETINGYTNSNDKTKLTKYKISVDLAGGTVTLAIFDGGEYKTVKTTGIKSTTLGTNGFDKVVFNHYKTASDGALNDNTMSVIDNVRVVKCGEPAKAEFEETFSDYSKVYGKSDSGTSTNEEYFSQLSTPRWTRGGTANWGINSYVCNFNGNKLLKQDIWQWGNAAETNVTSVPLEPSVKNGVVEISFDAAVQNPEDNIKKKYSNYFIVGVKDGKGNYMPALKIDTTDIFAFPTLAEGNESKLKYTNGNSYSSFNTYKIVLDFKTGNTEFYVKDAKDFVLAESGTLNKTITSNGFSSLVFSYKKFESGNGALAVDTGSLVDNIKINTEKSVVTPVVKAVRIDGAPASNAVAVNSKQFKIYFNKPMKKETLSGILISGASYPDGVYDEEDNSYTITIENELAALTPHTITVPTTVTDADGNALGRAYAGKFTTAKGIFMINEFALLEGASEATLATTAAGDKLTAKVNIKNSAELTGEYVLIYMIYDGDKLVNIDYVNVPFDETQPTTEKSIDMTIPETAGQLGVKVMLWDGFANMNQMMDAIELK